MGTYASLGDLDRKTRNRLEETFADSERFLGAIDCMDSVVPHRRTRLILTDSRLIEFERGAVRWSKTDYDRNSITSVTFDRGLVNRKLTVSGSGFSREWTLDPRAGEQFVAALREDRATRVFDDERHLGQSRSLGDADASQSDSDRSYEPTELKSRLQRLDEYEFEYFVADLWKEMGWSCEVSQASVDAGVDVVATKTHPYAEKKVIQAKRYSDSTTVGGPDVQQYASLKQQVENADSVIIVTTSSFTSSATERASELNVKLVDGDDLVRMIDDLGADDLVAEYVDLPTAETDSRTRDGDGSSDASRTETRTETRTTDPTRPAMESSRSFELSDVESYLSRTVSHGGKPYVLTLLATVSWGFLWLAMFAGASSGAVGVLVLFAWGGLPVGILLDTRSTGAYDDSRIRRWGYVVVAAVPMIALFSGVQYLRKRELRADAEDGAARLRDQSGPAFDSGESGLASSETVAESDDQT